jgi:murein peptide amidase A
MLAPVPILPLHQAHDQRALIARWRAVARASGLRFRVLTEVAGEKIFYLESPARNPEVATDYLSTGVHGDEAGSAWGLLTWAEKNLQQLREGSFLIFPCFNPQGLRNNTRLDHRGLDINRRFDQLDDPIAGPWRKLILQRKLRIALCLHEDFDSQGCYVYELSAAKLSISQKLMAACTQRIQADPRRVIEGSRAKGGIIRRSKLPPDFPGLPEAIVIWQLGCPISLTFETPSEFSLEDRVTTQAAFVSAALKHAPPL